MIGYVTIGTNNLKDGVAFYDELLDVVGATRVLEGDNFVAWGTGPSSPALSLIEPFDKQPASVGNGTMIAIAVDAPEKVHAVHAKALELGGADEGAPGPRLAGFYAGYFRDLDGNKLNAFCIVQDDG